MAKAAHGLADDLASTVLLATDKPVLMAPAMNVRMWEHPATRRNRARLADDGVAFVGPDEGAMACGEYGFGRMAEPTEIFRAALAALDPKTGSLRGLRALVTAGPTLEPIDPVRFVSNRSSGLQGYAIAQALALEGADVVLVSGPTHLAAPVGVRRMEVETAAEMMAASQAALPVDVAVMVAAVADWRPRARSQQKLKKTAAAAEVLDLTPTVDILAALSVKGPRRPRLVVGFAAETESLDEHAEDKRRRKGCDWIVGNDVSGDVMGGPENCVSLYRASGVERWPRAAKVEIARRLVGEIAATLAVAP
jgi:phosphopantothenoylcysteine decarboxylase/phosphopantothenate--cysteine ligase